MQRHHDTTAITAGRDDKPARHTLVETPRFFADVHVLRPGQSQAAHVHAREDKCWFVLSGTARVTTGPEVREVGPGTLVWCPAGEAHGVENADPGEDLRLLVFMAPHPRPPA
jgi:quercetin dioxygenase-like cupin family protein